ncbi:Uncharacterised protein [Klebsiella michiganensis]|nr:Uncharacterised protein [Klebsiella michiganensis]
MSKQASAIWAGAWDSIKSPMNVLKDLGKGDFSGAWKDLKHIPGNQERANSKTLNSFGIRGWVGDHPGETAAAIAGSILGGSALMGGGAAAGSGAAGASGSTAAPITAAVGTPVTQTGTGGRYRNSWYSCCIRNGVWNHGNNAKLGGLRPDGQLSAQRFHHR